MKDLFNVLRDILEYLFNLKIVDIPRILAYTGILACGSYMAALIIIGFPCSIYKDLTKKEINDEKEEKVTKYVAVCLFVVFSLGLLYEEVS